MDLFDLPRRVRRVRLQPLPHLPPHRRVGPLEPMRVARDEPALPVASMGDVRRSRNVRRTGGHVTLTKRDVAILKAVARFRVAESPALLRLFFTGASRERGSQRLRQLFDSGFLQVRLGKLSEPNVYSLGEAGRRWAQEHGVPAGRVPSGDIAHHLAVVELWSRLAVSLSQRDDLRLGSFRADWETRERGAGTLPVIPDGLVEIRQRCEGGGSARIALEVDLGSERPEVIREKLLAYGQLQSGSPTVLAWPGFSLAVVLVRGGSRRVQTLTELLKTFWPGASLLLRTEEWPGLLLEKLAAGALPTDSTNGRKGLADLTSGTPTNAAQEDREPSR